MLLIAHRGGTDRFPELTIEASKLSLALGADYIEMDIRFTSDHVPVISHDDDALKLFGNPTRISDMTAEQFVALTYVEDASFHPHTLEDVLSGGIAPILFHIKEGGEPLVQILDCIRAHGYEDRVIMGVMTSNDVRDVKKYNASIQVLAFMPAKGHAQEFIDSGADIIRLWEEWVNQEAVDRIHAAGRQIWVMAGLRGATTGYTSPENIEMWKAMGVDGVLVDLVEETKLILEASSQKLVLGSKAEPANNK